MKILISRKKKLNNLQTNYIKHITRNSIYGKEYIPLNLNKDVLMFGIHGGFEWPGGSLDLANNQIIIPSNHYPWIIRSFYTTKKNFWYSQVYCALNLTPAPLFINEKGYFYSEFNLIITMIY